MLSCLEAVPDSNTLACLQYLVAEMGTRVLRFGFELHLNPVPVGLGLKFRTVELKPELDQDMPDWAFTLLYTGDHGTFKTICSKAAYICIYIYIYIY